MKFSVALYVCLLPIMLSAQSTFSNKVYGISLQVPSNYKLHRGELGEDYSLGYLGQYPNVYFERAGTQQCGHSARNEIT
jgi:hypothetical protein